VGVFDVGWNLLIFSVKTKNRKNVKKKFTRSKTMEAQKERLDRQARILFHFILLFTIKTLFPLLTRTRFALFISFPYWD